MNRWQALVPKLAYLCLAAFVLTLAARSHNETTLAIVASSFFMFAACWANATHLLGARTAFKFVALAVCLGWFAEQMGSSRGWFFGSYTYTDVLGWRIGDVPAIIPLMWFVLCYTAFVLANLLIWLRPVYLPESNWGTAFMSFLAAALVTAYDLAADPYMVFKLKAWIMTKTDGWWFGETLQGFVGWMQVSFVILFLFSLELRRVRAQPTVTGAVPTVSGNAVYSKWDALLPLTIYGGSMVFQALNGTPVETRTVSVFAMGIPLLCAVAGWWRWRAQDAADGSASAPLPVSVERLAHLRYVADPLADQTIAAVLQPWTDTSKAANFAQISEVNRAFGLWTNNHAINSGLAPQSGVNEPVQVALDAYLKAGRVLPPWADTDKILRAEALFTQYGPMSCTLLFCASLPECYVLPDLAAVLHLSGQLEQHTDYRIRATAAMIFPVMLQGGLTQPEGAGVAQVLKVRLIHATIRNLILRTSPEQAMAQLADQHFMAGAGGIAAAPASGASMYEVLLAHGWRLGDEGLPCNQEELAYTLLTFGYVFLRGMRQLGLALPPGDEEAYLHLWNVVGHILGIRDELLPQNMGQAATMFDQIQSRASGGKSDVPGQPDPRTALGAALIHAMQAAMPLRLFRSVPVLFTRFLCGPATATVIGVSQHVSWLSTALFFLTMGVVRLIDSVVGFFLPGFALSRMLTRVVGYHLMRKILLDQTRPLKLPDHLINQVGDTMGQWSDDAQAPGWLNRLEDKLTRTGAWNAPIHSRPAPPLNTDLS